MGNFIDRKGEIHGDCLIVQELGHKKVLAKCLKCNNIDEKVKSKIVAKSTRCKFCDDRVRSRVGEIHRGLKIIEELGGRKVRCECTKCKHVDI